MASGTIDHRLRTEPTLKTLRWLIQLRWVAVIGQLIAVGTATVLLKIDLSNASLLGLIGFTALTNILISSVLYRYRWIVTHPSVSHPKIELVDDNPEKTHAWDNIHIRSELLAAILLVDVLTLTGLLYHSGGAANPFACFYFANIVVGGLVLSPIWTWTLAAVTVACTAFLLAFADRQANIGISFQAGLKFFSVPKQGLLIALATCCCVITYFVTALVRELRRRESRLTEAEAQAERAQRVEALATLAAGAGHELASPLSTIAVVAKELSRKLEKSQVDANVKRDVDLIRSELDRCREVLQRMKSSAGEAAAEVMNRVEVDELIETILHPLRQPERVEVIVEPILRSQSIQLPLHAVSQAIRNLVQNALDATTPPTKVAMHFQSADAAWRILIIDQGTGMADDVLRRVGQPFYTTKEVGQGMGLGVFLTHNVIQGIGGNVRFESQFGKGTTVYILLPLPARPGLRN